MPGIPPTPTPDGYGPGEAALGEGTREGADRPQSLAVPGWLAYLVAVLVTGAVAEGIARINRGAGYGFVGLVLLGYAATGGRINRLDDFFESVGVIAT